MRASLSALAKSIYYHILNKQGLTGNAENNKEY